MAPVQSGQRLSGRRAWLRAALPAVLFGPSGVFAQGPPAAARRPRIARISTSVPLADNTGPNPRDRAARAFVQGLRELGWEDGRNLVIEHRSAEGKPERLPALLRELTELPVDLIVVGGNLGAQAARRATQTIPIVAIGPDLVGLGLAKSLGRPGGNVTGLSFVAGSELTGKRLELLKAAVPSVRRVTYLGSRPPASARPWSAKADAAARELGITLQPAFVDSVADIEPTFAELRRQRPDALLVGLAPALIAQHARVVELANQARLPAMYGFRQFTESGGLMSYGPNFFEIERRAALYVDKILKGAKAGELPIEQPTRFELVINQSTAAALGLKLPQALRVQADEWIG